MISMDALKKSDSGIYDCVRKEIEREEYSLILIASENYVDQDVLEAQGTLLTNKYAEGYPDRRFYGGCRYVDAIERIAIERACRALRRRIRECAAPLGVVGQHGGLLRRASPGRQDPRHGPHPWRPSHPWLALKLLGPLFHAPLLSGLPERRADRLRSGAGDQRARRGRN